MGNPICKICGGTDRDVQFNLFPKLKQFKFGDICVKCEQVEAECEVINAELTEG